MSAKSKKLTSAKRANVCLIVEGCYPFVAGGVSTWLDWLIRGNPQISFSVVAIVADPAPREPRYRLPPNVIQFDVLALHQTFSFSSWDGGNTAPHVQSAFVEELIALVGGGRLATFRRVAELFHEEENGFTPQALMASPLSWRLCCETYRRLMPHASFLHFFWAWRALFGGLFSVLGFQLPEADVYHTISTGYAGLLAARGAVETGSPAIITEHGIYTNERRIEILMAEWISDTVDKGLDLNDSRLDLRDVWIQIFEAHSHVCYEACARIITLYEDNQRLQLALGAPAERLLIIPNGIDSGRFEHINIEKNPTQPTIALVGRVVPIKDVKCYIEAASIIRQRFVNVRALIMGPIDEDKQYYDECAQLITKLGLHDVVIFTGSVNIAEYFPSIHVVVLTSLSEAQPLVILEAGAAGIPCVATDVGSCRELINGRLSEYPSLGSGGDITQLVNPQQTADATIRLLEDEDSRRRKGQALRSRVSQYYSSRESLNSYKQLYDELITSSPASNNSR
jgi:glycosyltransferase involved in cell wall biosynthesis